MRKGIGYLIYFLVISLLLNNLAYSDDHPSWEEFVSNLRTEMIADGIKPEVFDAAFQNIHAPSHSVLHLDKTQPERRLNFLQYRNTRVDHYRILLGRRAFHRNQEVLNEIGNRYGVNSCFIVSIWGLETSYGRYRGKFPVIQSLATLAFDPRRQDYFHNELRIALHMLNDGQVNLGDFKGEWAGASGHCQFMPSTWLHYAVDYDGTGHADIWNNLDDAFASIANFLVKNGWHQNEPWAIQVSIPSYFTEDLVNLKTTKPLSEWARLGVQPLEGEFPQQDLPASIIYPDGGPAFMVFDNFKTLLKWNKSTYYAGALGYLAEEICQRKL